MPRRSARLAANAKQHGSQQQTAAARTLAIPELLDMVMEHAFTYGDAIQFRSVNRLLRDATDARLVHSILMGVEGAITWPPARPGKTTYRLIRLGQILTGANSERLKTFVHNAVVLQGAKPERLGTYFNLVSLTLVEQMLDKLAMLFATAPFHLPKLAHLEVEIATPNNSLCPRTHVRTFLSSFASLTTLHVLLNGWSYLPDFGLEDLVRDLAHRIRGLRLQPYDVEDIRARELQSLLDLFPNLIDLFLWVEIHDEDEDVTQAIPQSVQNLTMECDRTTLQCVLRRLADHCWLPQLRKVPYLQEIGRNGGGEYIGGTMSSYHVRRAVEGLKKRNGVKDVDTHACLLYGLIGEDFSDHFDEAPDSDSSD